LFTPFRNVLPRIYGILCGSLEIPGGPLVVFSWFLFHFSFSMFDRSAQELAGLLIRYSAMVISLPQ